uniref:Uncharacterized protein n=1 Tax=Anopheles farauti TaxID=69004 RepID=A0A182QDP8_9DIPT
MNNSYEYDATMECRENGVLRGAIKHTNRACPESTNFSSERNFASSSSNVAAAAAAAPTLPGDVFWKTNENGDFGGLGAINCVRRISKISVPKVSFTERQNGFAIGRPDKTPAEGAAHRSEDNRVN